MTNKGTLVSRTAKLIILDKFKTTALKDSAVERIGGQLLVTTTAADGLEHFKNKELNT